MCDASERSIARLLTFAVVAALPALLVGAIALDHNPQEVYLQEGKRPTVQWLLLTGSYFVIFEGIALVLWRFMSHDNSS